MSSRDYAAEYEEEERGQTRAAAVRLSPVVQLRRSRYAVSPISPAAAYKTESRLLICKAEVACVRGDEEMKTEYRQHGAHPTRREQWASSGCMLFNTGRARELPTQRGLGPSQP